MFYSYTVPRCNPPRFPDEAKVIHPRKMPKTFKHSDTILLRCKDGYFKSGIGALKCKKGDIWTGGITCSREFLLCCPYSLTNTFSLRNVLSLSFKGCIHGTYSTHFLWKVFTCWANFTMLPLLNKSDLESNLVVAHLKEYYLRSFDHKYSWYQYVVTQ